MLVCPNIDATLDFQALARSRDGRAMLPSHGRRSADQARPDMPEWRRPIPLSAVTLRTRKPGVDSADQACSNAPNRLNLPRGLDPGKSKEGTINGHRETYISVDVETSGPDPSQYSLLTIGACLVKDPEQGLYLELQPVTMKATSEALTITNLSLQELERTGLPPAEAMARFEEWLQAQVPEGDRPVFVAFNAPFDWMFVNTYFHRYLGRNPFGHNAMDMKSIYVGLAGAAWSEAGVKHVAQHYGIDLDLTHHALKDAQDQARLFQEMLREIQSRKSVFRRETGSEGIEE